MNNNAAGWVLFALSLPAVIFGYIAMGLLFLFRIAEFKTRRWQGAGVLTARANPKFAKRWGFTTTLGRAVLYHPSAWDQTEEVDNQVEKHEFVHIKQWEDACVWGFASGLFSGLLAWWMTGYGVGAFFAVWMTVWLLSVATMATNFLTAIARYGPKGIYLDTEHERSAYAQTDLIRHADMSWDDIRDEWRKHQAGNIT